MEFKDKYYTETEEIESEPGCWNTLKVKIFLRSLEKTKEIGEYHRNYSSMLNTFVPFLQHGKEYALYSNNYTCTRVMSLPDCKDIAGEKPDAFGFCPVDFFVPYEPENGIHGDFGFVAGCIWGDDSSWKLQFLDLRGIDKGKFDRKDKFGYFELPDLPLKDCIDMEDYFIGSVKLSDEETVNVNDRIIRVAQRAIFILDKEYESLRKL